MAPGRDRTRKEAKLTTEEPKEMKIHGGAESRVAQAENIAPKSEEEEKKNTFRVKVNKRSEIRMTGHKAMKRWVSKMQRKNSGEGSQISVNRAKDFKDDTTVALEDDCSDIQGGFSSYFFFNVIFNSSSICVV